MKILYLGHSSFLIATSNGTRVVCDPFPPEIGYPFPSCSADCVTISHRHYDHDAADLVGGDKKIFEGECNESFKDLKISSFKCWHDEVKGAKRGANYAFKIECDGKTVVHLGDLGEYKNDALCKWAKGADVLLIPVGGNYTIDGKTAARYVKDIQPRYAVPMHYAQGGNIDISGAEEFLNCFPSYVKDPTPFVPGDDDKETKIIFIERI